jgi:SAM-dependent methyltransferase
MDRYYPKRYRKYGTLTARVLTALYRFRIRQWARHLPKTGRAFELGCGDGWMLAALRARGWRVFGSERSQEGARAALAGHQVPMYAGDLSSLRSSSTFDLVILFQVLEHLSDPYATLRRGAEILGAGGVMVVAVPNAGSWQARFFGPLWFHLDVPRHLSHFSPASLTYALEKVGLRVVRRRWVSLEHDPFGLLQSALNRLGFQQNLLTKILMGMETGTSAATLSLMCAVAAILVVPSVLCAVGAWAAGSGAILEMWAVKR